MRIHKEKHIHGGKIRLKVKFYKWFWLNRSVFLGMERIKRWRMDPKKKENKAIVYYTSWWTNGLYADLIDSFRRAWDSGNDQRPRRYQWSNLCVINYTSLPAERGQSFVRVVYRDGFHINVQRWDAGTQWEGLVMWGVSAPKGWIFSKTQGDPEIWAPGIVWGVIASGVSIAASLLKIHNSRFVLTELYL